MKNRILLYHTGEAERRAETLRKAGRKKVGPGNNFQIHPRRSLEEVTQNKRAG